MLPRLVKGQILAFVVLAVLAVGYAANTYLRLPEQLGFGRYRLTVELPSSGDLYPNATVTMHGIPIGEVRDITLTDTGAAAILSIDDNAAIPRDSRVTVRSVSAIGEQYLNFEPPDAAGPVLAAGAVVPAGQVRLPVPDIALLRDANRLVASLPRRDLNTTINELSAAFTGSGADLRRLVDSTSALMASAHANIGPTRRLIGDLSPVLDTQRQLAPRLRSIVANLATVTAQLRRSDPALRGTIDKTPPALDEADRLLNQLRPTLPMLLSDLSGAVANSG
jgi:phospholipid/cholesterol/gamma-HCH transport system substrate-binding protein